ncbi:hypothetical protein [Rhodococcus sp. ACT016]|uniref:hypothetical protein n=1 Tax=Rhodococcus sp. ACT016 TaxID=3134808 RepID=UPI003D289D87
MGINALCCGSTTPEAGSVVTSLAMVSVLVEPAFSTVTGDVDQDSSADDALLGS